MPRVRKSRDQWEQSLTDVRELPPCSGPKLNAFEHRDASIQWLERLDDSDTREDQSETQGFVFKVNIKSRTYALKVFKFFDPLPEYEFWLPLLGKSIAPEMIAFHTDPFYAECRAYGRIKEATEQGKLKRQVAIPCHGFVLLKSQDERELISRGIDLGRKRGESHPVRAIVKELAPETIKIVPKRVLADIRLLNAQKIYNKDVRIDNFRDGQLVDFGSAWTEPHCILDALKRENEDEVRDTKLEDLVMFDDMIRDEGIKTRVKAMPDWQCLRKLRRRTKV